MAYFTTTPIWILGLTLVVLPTLVAMAAPPAIRRVMSLEMLRTNNEVAGFKFAVVGVLYAVLLAFAVVVVWQNFSDSDSQVAEEAGAAATIYRLADGLDGTTAPQLRGALTQYLQVAVAEDWPAMERGQGSVAATSALNDLYQAALRFSPSSNRDGVILGEVLHQLDLLTQARRDRLVSSSGIVPDLLWVILFGGAILTVGFTFFFGTEHILAQSGMTGILTLLIFSGLLIIVVIDHPFAGSARVSPEAITAVMDELGK
ncbi:MAG TPA: DUF4239 domain-containing protein [Devosiaceae bacterium]|jgi:hypothetical protein